MRVGTKLRDVLRSKGGSPATVRPTALDPERVALRLDFPLYEPRLEATASPTFSPEYSARRETRLSDLRATLNRAVGEKTALTLEIGCGHGHYLTALAGAQPNSQYLGIDIMADRIRRAERKRERAKLSHLHFVRADAIDTLLALPAGVLLEKILILFPDPWPKRRHHKNRILQTSFLDQLADRAMLGATLYFRTDHNDYFEEARATLQSHPRWKIQENAPWPFELVTVFQSRADTYQSVVATMRI